ncbi:MAG: hypothetical protein IBJ15_21435, partial [Alphaproteobacteria bacterium]|nr:hypothetical protein [Alphaproteobacteria bacterium]
MTDLINEPIELGRGPELRCKGWRQEGLLRMLENTLTNGEKPQQLIIYGGSRGGAPDLECPHRRGGTPDTPPPPGPPATPAGHAGPAVAPPRAHHPRPHRATPPAAQRRACGERP